METLKKTGLPDEVTSYHPIEFLELSKPVLGFLHTQLEAYKGGARNQMLVGHVMKVVAEKGVAFFATLPFYRDNYTQEILEKFKRKGIDLTKVKKVDVDSKKLELLSDGKSVYQSQDAIVKSSNIYCSSNYSMFHFLPFNRSISRTHVNALVESIRENGVISYPIMVRTDCIDGTLRYWIVDGQHRFSAFIKLGFPVYFTLHQKQGEEPVTKKDIVKLVARVNNTSRKWNLQQYLRAWASLNAEDYKVIKDDYDKTKIAINTLLQAYSGEDRRIATKKFVNGVYQITDRQNGALHIARLVELKGLIPKNTSLQSALLDLFRRYSHYDNDAMKEKLRKTKGKYVYGETQEEILENLDKLYNS